MKANFKKTILIDLDGVLNTYIGNYDENFIPQIKEGAKEFLKELSKNYRIVIFTTRNLLISSKWVMDNGIDKYISNISNHKEPCYLVIDDRCINFDGNYSGLKDRIDKFQPWYKNL